MIFDNPQRMSFQRMDDTFAVFGNKSARPRSRSPSQARQREMGSDLRLRATRAPDRMVMSGEMDGKKVRMELELFPRDRFLLVTRGSDWCRNSRSIGELRLSRQQKAVSGV